MKLLIVVDYQNDFVDGSLGFPKAKLLEPIILKKLSEAEHIIFTLDTHQENYLTTLEGQKLPVKHTIKNTFGWQLYGRVADYLNKAEKVFEKATFPSLELANYLRNTNYDEVEICGLVSNICVVSNAVMVRAALPNAKIVVDYLATSSFDEKMNEACFDILSSIHVDVINRGSHE